jgi:hypothetical protein
MAAAAPTTHFAIIETTAKGPRARYTVPTKIDGAAERAESLRARVATSGNPVAVTTVTH